MNFLNFILENKNAIIAIPQEVKIIFLIALGLSIIIGLIRGLWNLIRIAAVVAIVYFIASFFGVF